MLDERELVMKIRNLGGTLTKETLEILSENLYNHSWKVRLEITKILKKYIQGESNPLQEKAMEILLKLSEDIHPVVRLCVFEIRRLRYLEEAMMRKKAS